MCLIPVSSLENNFHKHMWFPSLKNNSLGNKKCKAVDLSSNFQIIGVYMQFWRGSVHKFPFGSFFFSSVREFLQT